MYRGVFRFCLFASVTLVPWTSLSSQSSAIDAKRADGLAAWEQVYSVLVYPRCINCHTATNYPQQGDDRHRHFANVIRGPEGKRYRTLPLVSL